MAGTTVQKEKNEAIIKKFGTSAKDSGSTDVQVALLTSRINELNGHFTKNPKDHHSRQGLLKMVGQRRRLLTYLRGSNPKRYMQVIQDLGLRK
jgi:small subunit ribosomal protein S15